jgi:putative ABC transport system permease protein
MNIQAASLRVVLQDIRDGLRSRAGRTALTLFAVIIGFASLTALLAVLGGLESKSQRIVKELGINVAGIFRQKSVDAKVDRGLEERHREVLARSFADCLFSSVRRFSVPTAGKDEPLTVIATDGDLARVRQWRLVEGRFLDAGDVAIRRRVAVISRSLNGRWGWKIDDLIELRGALFRVVGILDVGNGGLDAEMDTSPWIYGELVVFVPKTLGPLWLKAWDGPRPPVDAIFMSVPATRDFGQTVDLGRRLLAQPDLNAGLPSWVLPDTLRAGIQSLEKTIAWTGGSVSALCLILGGLTLMSLMIANVRDRVCEIGLRRSLGAMPRDIAFLFFLEGELTACAAAVIAVIFVHLVVLAGRLQTPFPLKLGASTVLVPIAAAAILAAVFSYGPARLAARIMPSEALRYE